MPVRAQLMCPTTSQFMSQPMAVLKAPTLQDEDRQPSTSAQLLLQFTESLWTSPSLACLA